MYSVITTALNVGIRAVPVQVEADISEGMPVFSMVGFLSSEVKEAKERVQTALRNCGYRLPPKHITINLTPANIRKSGNSCDLPVALVLLSGFGYFDYRLLQDYLVLGEISLNGDILPVKGVLPVAVMAKEHGYQGLILPAENAREAAILPELKVIPVHNLKELIVMCQDELEHVEFCEYREEIWKTEYDVDYSEIRGQKILKRGCEVAVSGMHNLLMIGPPGSGKTMAARRIPTILPELTRQEKLELSQIYSLGGLLTEERIIQNERPFRCPHHTTTPIALAGGGKPPVPGEISLAHRGVLFLDELPEFGRNSLEILREPLEEKVIRISRLGISYTFPADLLLICSMNPCPCGYYPDMNRCSCTALSIQQYMNRISQALLNRIDLCVETRELKAAEMLTAGEGHEESSESIRKRVEQVWAVQKERFADSETLFNSRMTQEEIKRYCVLSKAGEKLMEEKYEEYHLNARSYFKVLKVARTLADMDGRDNISEKHLTEALFFRSPDKKYWRRY